MKRSELFLMTLQVPVDFLMMMLASVVAYYARLHPKIVAIREVQFDITLIQYLHIAVWVAIGWQLIFAVLGLYIADPRRKFGTDITRMLLGGCIGLGAVAIYMVFTLTLFDSRFLILAGWFFAMIFLIIGRLLVRGYKGILYRSGVGLRSVVVIGSDETTESFVQTLKTQPEFGYQVVGVFSSFDEKTEKELQQISCDELILIHPRAREKDTLRAMEFCANAHIELKYTADLMATYAANLQVHALAGIPIAEFRQIRIGAWGRIIKRVFDILFSIFALTVTSPIMLLSVLIIYFETGKPIIYKNERIGLHGKKFFVYKFRSMFQKDSTGAQFGVSGKKAEEKEKELIKKQSVRQGPVYKIANDPRVTPFGRFIRATSIDELPQFLNVLKGEMSVVGPRPHQEREVAGHKRHNQQVLSIKPGITGLAQISGRSDIAFDEEVKLDILYIEKWNLLLDVIIIIKTPFILLKRRKAL